MFEWFNFPSFILGTLVGCNLGIVIFALLRISAESDSTNGGFCGTVTHSETQGESK